MKIKGLLKEWEKNASAPRTAREYAVRLPVHDAARIMALVEIYPGRTETNIITDLLAAALDELEEVMPYVQGQRVIAMDDHGDPIYEDSGLTPRLYRLTKHYERILEEERAQRAK